MFKKIIPWLLLVGTIALVLVVSLQASNDATSPALTDAESGRLAPNTASAAAASPSSCGDVNANGSVTSADVIGLVNYVFKGGAAPTCLGCQLAWGSVNTSGAVLNAGSGNWSCVWSAVNSRYVITITDENYFYTQYHTSITPILTSAPHFVANNSVGGDLLVFMKDAAGANVQSAFSFTVIKL